MSRALNALDGRVLTEVNVLTGGASEFQFDQGLRFRTWPASAGSYGAEPVEQWMLYQPTGEVLSLWSDGSRSARDATAG
jgi:hypothetical protein